MKKMISLSLIFCLASVIIFLRFHSLESGIKEIYSFNEVNFKEIQNKKNILVIFDVDQTLIQPTDAYLMHESTLQGERFRQQLLEKYPKVKDWDTIQSIMVKKAERPLIEPEVIHHINALKKNALPVIACTGMNTGPYGILPSMEQWRYEHLKSLGFEGSFNDIIFTLKSSDHKPVFYKGILATDTASKGPVIGAFLEEMQLNPNEIIMFDDSFDFLISVQHECKQRGIIFKGYFYKGASLVKDKPWDEKLFNLQAEYLIKNRIWLNDETAHSFLAEFGDVHVGPKIMHK